MGSRENTYRGTIRKPVLIVCLLGIAILALLNHSCSAQESNRAAVGESEVKLPRFDVASVKPSTSPFMNTLLNYPGGRIVAQGCTLHYLIMEAFHMQSFQIRGIPHSLEEERFDIEAKPPATSATIKLNPAISKLPPSNEQRQMLQALLIDRFQLKFHRETKQGKIYILSTNDKGTEIQATKDPTAYPWAGSIAGGRPGGDGLRGINITMSQLAERVSQWIERPVIDQTKLNGSFDFEYRNSENDAETSTDLQASIFSALRGIGLNLKATDGPVESLVVDRIGKPTAN